ncbi:peptidyl-prolyl cis-trans isomerase [Fervidobacterium islandicum]|uniref:Peptidyl-prolyl cis-trans isomerase n=1 Tax=Fervidobacterium islandicum TaxID=2423 RepID=A0AAI8GCH3_FERIS|nr:peptidyl-prolyl cis-trans isomerase [Fervidobacterium islandicum]AMW31926.1 peptidyl-prolyl cis-trans isomerase [Fervidobacterium islandicum]
MKRLAVFLFLVLSLLTFAQQDIVAVVNGRNITMDEWNREANVQKLLLDIQKTNQTFYTVLTNTQEGLALLERYKLAVLDQLITKVLFIQFAEKKGVAPDDKDIKNYVDNEIKKMLTEASMTEAELNDYLVELGMGTLNDYKEKLYFQRKYSLSIANVYAQYLTASVSDAEVKAYYEKNKEKYTVPSQYDLLVFKTNNKTTADSLRQDVIRGTSVDDISKKYNISPLINGWVNENDTTKLPKNLWLLVTNSIKGTTLPVQQVGNEFYVIRVRDIKLGGTKTLNDVAEEIKKELLAQKQEEATKKVLADFDEFKKTSKVEIRYKSNLIK